MTFRSIILFLVGLLALSVLAFICIGYHGPIIESDLTTRTQDALRAEGFNWTRVSADGQTIRLEGAASNPDQKTEAERIAAGVWGVDAVDNLIGMSDVLAQIESGEARPLVLDFANGRLRLSGSVPDERTRAQIAALAAVHVGEANLDNGLTVNAAASAAHIDTLVQALIPNIADLEEGHASIDGESIRVSGKAASALRRDDVERRIRENTAAGVELGFDISAPEIKIAEPETSQTVQGVSEAPPVSSEQRNAAIGSDTVTPNDVPTGKAATEIASSRTAARMNREACIRQFKKDSLGGPIYFRDQETELDNETVAGLDKLVELAAACPEVSFSVEGHTDWRGPQARNQPLSLERAEAVAAYLTSQGISPQQLSVTGFGEQHPVGDNATAEGRALNRRVEILVVEN